MTSKGPLHILFSMNCDSPERKAGPDRPRTWEQSCRSIESFCSQVLNAGYRATLFVSAACAAEHAPLLEEMAGRGIEIGLFLHPQSLLDGRFKGHLAEYNAEDQEAMIDYAAEQVEEAIGSRPRSFRGGDFSASDATYKVLYALGFRQGSLSNPGRDVRRHVAHWSGAEVDAHYVDPADRLKAGSLPFLELPVTTDPEEIDRAGFALDLCIESGPFEGWHRSLAERQIERMEAEQVLFRSLCFFTHNAVPYQLADAPQTQTLQAILDYLDSLAEQYEIVPATMAAAHDHFRRMRAG